MILNVFVNDFGMEFPGVFERLFNDFLMDFPNVFNIFDVDVG